MNHILENNAVKFEISKKIKKQANNNKKKQVKTPMFGNNKIFLINLWVK